MNGKFLLYDETGLSKEDFGERKLLVEEFSALPKEFFSKLRHLQPQTGCLNACKICSQFAKRKICSWSEKRLRNVIAALKFSAEKYRTEKPFLVWDRPEHRSGVIFPYLDNDVGNYEHLYEYVSLTYNELGVKTRISTVGYSRHNEKLNAMHRKIAEECTEMLAGVRLSLTPYAAGVIKNPNEYFRDVANFLTVYKAYFDKEGCGSRNFCVELRYKPLVVLAPVYDVDVCKHKIICVKNYLYISAEENVILQEAKIADPYDHHITLTEPPKFFRQIDLDFCPVDIAEVKRVAKKFIREHDTKKNLVEVYLMKNVDGAYYSISPRMTTEGNFGINVYPSTNTARKSGLLITERFFVNALLSHGAKKSAKPTWHDAEEVLADLNAQAENYAAQKKIEKANYIRREMIPLLKDYMNAVKSAGYAAEVFFDENFTIDTGIICNLGGALSEFKGLTEKKNEPLTPVHERNYGGHNSTMTKENVAWRLSCGFGNKIIVNKLNLFEVSSENGQFASFKEIKVRTDDAEQFFTDLKTQYLIPGQKPQEIRFYKEFGDLGYLASYSPHGFFKDGIWWKTVEHYYQAQKFEDETVREKIIRAETPKEASTIGRSREFRLRENWNEIRAKIMYDAVYLKFKAHDDIRAKLLATGEADIVEETVKENYWGCGPKRDGQNVFGKILCAVRSALRHETKEEFHMYYISRVGYKKLLSAYDNVDNEIAELNRKIGESVKSDNDLRENPEFMQLRVKAMYELPQKKKTLLQKYRDAVIIEDTAEYKNFDGTQIIIGSVATITFGDEECTYTILGNDEGDIDNDILSCEAPLSKLLVGKKVGDKFIFNDEDIVILKITLPPAAK